MNLIIYGAGGTGTEFVDIANRLPDSIWQKIYFLDDAPNDALNSSKEKYKIQILSFDAIAMDNSEVNVVIAVGEPAIREKLAKKISLKEWKLTCLIDPSVRVSETAKLLAGCVLYPGVKVSSNTVLKENVLVQFNSVVGHDVCVGENTIISSNVCVGGSVEIGVNCFIGMGAIIKEGLTIGNNSIIGMGSVVHRDIPDGVIALGDPARVAKRNEDKKVFS